MSLVIAKAKILLARNPTWTKVQAEAEAVRQLNIERLRNPGITGMNKPLSLAANYIVVGTAKMAKGAVKFADWSVQMVNEFGETIRPYLRQIYARARILHDEVHADLTAFHARAVELGSRLNVPEASVPAGSHERRTITRAAEGDQFFQEAAALRDQGRSVVADTPVTREIADHKAKANANPTAALADAMTESDPIRKQNKLIGFLQAASENQRTETDMFELASKNATIAGTILRATRELMKTTPEGIGRFHVKIIAKFAERRNFPLTRELRKELESMFTEAERYTDPQTRQDALQDAMDYAESKLPMRVTDLLSAYIYNNLPSNPRAYELSDGLETPEPKSLSKARLRAYGLIGGGIGVLIAVGRPWEWPTMNAAAITGRLAPIVLLWLLALADLGRRFRQAKGDIPGSLTTGNGLVVAARKAGTTLGSHQERILRHAPVQGGAFRRAHVSRSMVERELLLGASLMSKGFIQYTTWRLEMLAACGRTVEPRLPQLHNRSMTLHNEGLFDGQLRARAYELSDGLETPEPESQPESDGRTLPQAEAKPSNAVEIRTEANKGTDEPGKQDARAEGFLNLTQKIVLAVGLLGFLAAGLFPQWIGERGGGAAFEGFGAKAVTHRATGRHCILSAHAYARDFVDIRRLALEWGLIILPTVGLVLILGTQRRK